MIDTDSFKVNIGIELQASECLLFFESLENNGLLHQTDKVVYYVVQAGPDIHPHIELYGDRMSNKQLKSQFNSFIKHYKGSTFRFEDLTETSEKKSYPILLDEEAITDAEFILTYLKFENTSISEIFKYTIKKLLDAYEQIERILKSRPVRLVCDLYVQKRSFREKKCQTAPFDRGNKWYHYESETYDKAPFHLLTLNEQIPDSFMTQVTLGIPYSKIVDVLEHFCILFSSRLNPSSSNYKMEHLDLILNTKRQFIMIYGKDNLQIYHKVYTMLILIRYIYKSRKRLKEYPFFIRHHISSLLKILSQQEFKLLINWMQGLYDFSEYYMLFLRRAYEKVPLQEYYQLLKSEQHPFTEDDLNRECKNLANFEDTILEGSIFPIKALTESNDKIILVEVRYINYLLCSYLDPPDERFLTKSDLNYILDKLEGRIVAKRTRDDSSSPSRPSSRRRKTK
jgi:hypothetical protein